MCIGRDYNHADILTVEEFCIDLKSGYWKPFAEITLDDEIAKLRPIVITNEIDQDILYGVRKNVAVFTYSADNIDNCRLATPHELQEIT